jgi:hypothetical protein
MEFTETDIEALLSNDAESLAKAGGDAAQIRSDTKKNYSRYSRVGNNILKNFVQFLKAYEAR